MLNREAEWDTIDVALRLSFGNRLIPLMSSPTDGTSAKRKIGPFVLEQKLGVGGMGIVYRAIYTKDGSTVALKVLSPGVSGNPQVVARFEREMAILKRLRHPNIVQYFGGGRSNGQNYFAMAYMPGGSVEHLVKKRGRLPWEEALEILKEVAQALEYAHSKGVIHRDLKPANLFLCGDHHVKLGDFGIARDSDATALTAAGKTVGTYAYMAPEQIAGKPPISRRTDLYALGCVGFELLTGRPPFVAETPAEMLFGHLNQQPPKVREFAIDCPLQLEEVIDRLLAKDPEDRYFDALAVQVALDEAKQKVADQESFVKQTLQGGLTTGVATVDGKAIHDIVRGKPKKKRKKSVPIYERAWFLALCLLAVVGGITWAAWPASEAELYAAAVPLMKSEERSDWLEARDDYLAPLVERFPDGKHTEQARAWLEQIELDSLERQIETRLRLRQEPRSEAERLYMDALRFENESRDRIAAIGKYGSVAKVLRTNPNARNVLKLTEKRMSVLETKIGSGDIVETLRRALRKAERNEAEGRTAEARDIWNGIVDLYGDSVELNAFVRYAKARLAREEPPPLDLGEDQAVDGAEERNERTE